MSVTNADIVQAARAFVEAQDVYIAASAAMAGEWPPDTDARDVPGFARALDAIRAMDQARDHLGELVRIQRARED